MNSTSNVDTHSVVQSLMLDADKRQILLVMTGSNGAGKTTFYERFIQPHWSAPFVNADLIAAKLDGQPLDGQPREARDYQAAKLAEQERNRLMAEGASFCFETVFSDTDGAKLSLLKAAAVQGYSVTLFFVGIDGPHVSRARVLGRVLHGGHDVPSNKLKERYPRTLANLRAALPHVGTALLVDNNSIANPYAFVALLKAGKVVHRAPDLPQWAQLVLET
jgi:predicted ABC-type ATPase